MVAETKQLTFRVKQLNMIAEQLIEQRTLREQMTEQRKIENKPVKKYEVLEIEHHSSVKLFTTIYGFRFYYLFSLFPQFHSRSSLYTDELHMNVHAPANR